MRNIHTIERPTLEILGVMPYGKSETQYQIECFLASRNVYITSNEIPKKGDYMLYGASSIVKCEIDIDTTTEHFKMYGMGAREKIIMTTDTKLIKDGVQAIPDEFLQWFVKNPSCESVEIKSNMCLVKRGQCDCSYQNVDCQCSGYKITIPKEETMFINDEDFERASLEDFIEEPKRETLEEDAENWLYDLENTNPLVLKKGYPLVPMKFGFIEGAKWQQERSYSELFEWLASKDYLSDKVETIQKEFEDFKNKNK
jgi:hypothetical protein